MIKSWLVSDMYAYGDDQAIIFEVKDFGDKD